MKQERIKELNQICLEMRKDTLRMAKAAGASGLHFGGTLSMIELMAVLYLEVMNWGPETAKDEKRDRFILSKGHGVPAVYAAMHQAGTISDEALDQFKADVTHLYAHPSMDADLGIEYASGSLGQGLSLGVGTAIGLRRKGNPAKVYVLLGDGECDEGSVWEAAMAASQYHLGNLVAIVDRNKIQYDGDTETVMALNSLEDKWKSFGFHVLTIDGHDVQQIHEALTYESDKPLVILAETVKGKGISFMEGDPGWHHKKMTAKQEKLAWEELENAGI